MHRAAILCAIFVPLALAAPAPEPLATFTGILRGASSKSLTIVDDDGNEVQFDCGRKTRYFDGSQTISVSALQPGDRVLVEARRTLIQRLEAVNVRRQKKAPPSEPGRDRNGAVGSTLTP